MRFAGGGGGMSSMSALRTRAWASEDIAGGGGLVRVRGGRDRGGAEGEARGGTEGGR